MGKQVAQLDGSDGLHESVVCPAMTEARPPSGHPQHGDGGPIAQRGCQEEAGTNDVVRPARMPSSIFGDHETLARDLPPNWTLKRFQDDVKEILDEYLSSSDLHEATQRTRDLLRTCPANDEFCVVAVRIAVDRDEAAEALTAKLLCSLSETGVVDAAGLVRSFEKLFCAWEDIQIDAPNSPSLILRILEKCVEAGIVHPALLTKVPEALLNAGRKDSDQSPSRANGALSRVGAELEKFKQEVKPCIEEYFVALSKEEVELFLKELDMPAYHHEFVKKVASASFSASNNPANARNAAISIFGHLSTQGILSKDDLQWGVTRLLGQLDDLALDCPRCTDLATDLLAAMVTDELVSVPFLRRCSFLRIGGATGVQVLRQTQRRTPEFSKRYLNTVQFKHELQTIIEEYFNSGDVTEFTRCVNDLAPWSEAQSAELVRKLMTYAMERSGAECELALQLLISLCRDEELTLPVMERAFDELYERMPDLTLDVPDAREMARTFVMEAQRAKLLRSDWKAPESAE